MHTARAARYADFSMTANAQNALSERVAAWIDDLAGHGESANAIAALGDAAIPALHDYLAGDPQAVPQARCFAVTMLARLQAEAATAALHDALHAHPLKTLTPPFAESEYVVKSDVLEALTARDYTGLADDVACGVRERLRVAVAVAGRLRMDALADALVDLLDDDVLAGDAMASLTAIGVHATATIMPRLDAWLTEGELSARRRLAVIRALCILRDTACRGADAAIRRALDDSHPAVRAAAALLVWPQRRDDAIVDALLHGALGFDRELADACRTALDDAGPGFRAVAERALQRDAEPDLYGRQHALSSEQRGWMKARLGRAQGACG
jgi:hypothetical protein